MAEKLIVQGFNQVGGKHCWTTALRNALNYHGLPISEEMLFGLGGGLGFIYWHMKQMSAPFIGGRYGKGTEPLVNTCRRIGAEVTVIETTSAKKGYEELKKVLREGEPVFTFVDMAYFPYFVIPEDAHFGAHTVLVIGLDEEKNKVYISDRCSQPMTVSIDDLNKARNSKFPPFPPKNRILKIEYPSVIGDLEKGIRESIGESCSGMLNPPIQNIGLKGIKKWAEIVPKWSKQFEGSSLFGCLFNTFIYIEIGGTGGNAFRPMYAKFLEEASSITNKTTLNEVAEMFKDSGKVWSEIATATLPDSWPTPKRIRELALEKNRILEEQPRGALEEMRRIGAEADSLISKALREVQERDTTPLLADLQRNILRLYEIESRAFERLNSII